MPELKISESSDGLTVFPMLQVLSIMAFPNDKDMREKHLATISAKLGDSLPEVDKEDFPPELRPRTITRGKWDKFATTLKRVAGEELEEIFLQMGGRPTLCNSPEYEKIIDLYGLNTYKGSLAGLILYYIWRMDATNATSGASVNKAKFLVNKLFREKRDPQSKNYPFNEKFINKAWSDFKPVSHLWAAFMIWEIWGRPIEYSPFLPLCILRFISLAEKFRKFGINYFPRGQKVPILLSEETWFPSKDFEPIDFLFEIHPLTSQELEVLGKYQAPISNY